MERHAVQLVLDKKLSASGIDLSDQVHEDLDAPPADRARFGIRAVSVDVTLVIEGHRVLPAMATADTAQEVQESIRSNPVLPAGLVRRTDTVASQPNLR
jgi:hypothetical protein